MFSAKLLLDVPLIGHDFGQSSPKKIMPEALSAQWVQFAQCLVELWNLVPYAFEFSRGFIMFLVDSVFSSRFGTFLATR